MKPIIFNKNSWHYKLAKIAGIEFKYEVDFCTYITRVISGLLLFAFFACVIVFVAFVCLTMIFSVFHAFHWIYIAASTMSLPQTTEFQVAGFTILGMIATFALFVTGLYLYLNYQPKEPGFIRRAYRSLKDKTCYRVEFKENINE